MIFKFSVISNHAIKVTESHFEGLAAKEAVLIVS